MTDLFTNDNSIYVKLENSEYIRLLILYALADFFCPLIIKIRKTATTYVKKKLELLFNNHNHKEEN